MTLALLHNGNISPGYDAKVMIYDYKTDHVYIQEPIQR